MNLLTSINPTNYQILGSVKASTEGEIRGAVKSARSALPVWRSLGVSGRVKALAKAYKTFEKRKEEIAIMTTKEMGMTISLSRAGDIADGLGYFRWYLDNAESILAPEITNEDDKTKHVVYFEPTGVAAVIVPWNWPFCNFVWGVIPQLVAGNTVVFKHSEEVPLFGKLIDEIIAACDFPAGVFTQVYGDGSVGDLLAHQDIDMISFTGSTKIGKYLYELAGKKFIMCLMEMGGSAPGIVFDNVDVHVVIDAIYSQRFGNCGQTCDALKRLIVHNKIFGEVVEKLANKLSKLSIGDPLRESTDIGPLVAKRQLDLLESQVTDAVKKGAKIIVGGKKPPGLPGAFYEPTILTEITPDMRVWREEVFGPVLPIVSFQTEEEAISLANDCDYGLGAYLYTQDAKRASRVAASVQSGMVNVNNTNYVIPWNPFGGYKSSGHGREHGTYGLRELTQIKVVSMPK